MRAALGDLGYRAYHMDQIGQIELPTEVHTPCWNEAFKAKIHGNGQRYGAHEFGKLLRNYDAVTDAPCCCFSDELLEAFPQTKVVLSTRDPDQWVSSIERSYYRILESNTWMFKFWRVMAVLDTEMMQGFQRILMYPLEYWTGGDWQNRVKLRQGLINHNEHIRRIVPREKLLEWNVKDGWAPLCKFLDKPVPAKAFPNVNSGFAAANLTFVIGMIRTASLVWKMVRWPFGMAGIVLLGFVVARTMNI